MKAGGRRIAGLLAVLGLLAAYLLLAPRQQILTEAAPAGSDSAGRPLFWFKGNTHAHAKISLGDYTHGDSPPAEVVQWYHDHGYHFICLTDHNRYSQAARITPPGATRADFLVVSGMEVTSDHRYPGVIQTGERKIHTTAFNTDRSTPWEFDNPGKAAIFSLQAERIADAGGIPVISHPNYRFQVELRDILDTKGVRHMEIANVHPRSNHAGHAGFRPGVEELWDQALTSGKLMFGVATDDAHDFKWHRQALRRFGLAPPGGAWIMVRAAELSAAAISEGMMNGDFYASTGVVLKQVSAEGGYYEVELDMQKTIYESRHPWIRRSAPVVPSDDGHFVIEFIGSHGRVLHATHNETRARIALDPGQGYVRARVSYLEKTPGWLNRDRARIFYAWTQPVMTAPAASAE